MRLISTLGIPALLLTLTHAPAVNRPATLSVGSPASTGLSRTLRGDTTTAPDTAPTVSLSRDSTATANTSTLTWVDTLFAGITLSAGQRAQIDSVHAVHLANVALIAKQSASATDQTPFQGQLAALDSVQLQAFRSILDAGQRTIFDKTWSEWTANALSAKAAAEGN